MVKDKRVRLVRELIESGSIRKYNDIYDLLPVTIIITLLKTNHKRLTKYNASPDLFTFRECFKIAKFLEITEAKMIELFYNQIVEDRKKRRPGKKE